MLFDYPITYHPYFYFDFVMLSDHLRDGKDPRSLTEAARGKAGGSDIFGARAMPPSDILFTRIYVSATIRIVCIVAQET